MTETRPRPPVPTSVSPEAQAWLSKAPFPDVPVPTRPDDIGGWQHYVAEVDRQIDEALCAQMPTDLPIERIDTDIDGVRTYVLRPHNVPDGPEAGIYLDIHGGALLALGGELCARMSTGGALGRNLVTWSVDYRMPPLHPYPAALDDCLTVYRRALRERAPEDIIVGGGSAGGNLAAALLLRAKDEGLPMPAALVLFTPEVDLTESGDSFVTNDGIDNVLGSLMDINRLYANGHDLAHSYLSPLFGDLTGFPPTILVTGTRDLFLSNTVRFHRKLRDVGVEADLHVWEAMPHGGFGGTAPEDIEVGMELSRFVERHRRGAKADHAG